MLITEMLSRNAQKYPNKVSLIEREPEKNIRRQITWLEFENESNRLANALRSFGVLPGDKVALLMMNCLEWLPVYFGILKTGALAAPLNFRFTAKEIGKCTEMSESKILIYGPEFQERIEKIQNKGTCIEKFIYVGTD